MLVALAVQLLLGVANNLWLHQSHPTLKKASPGSLLGAHTTWALIIIALAIWILVEAIRAKGGVRVAPAYTGLAGILIAYASGSVYYGNESNLWSFLMTVGFVIAVTSYALAGNRWEARGRGQTERA